jgi:hypothetical protein
MTLREAWQIPSPDPDGIIVRISINQLYMSVLSRDGKGEVQAYYVGGTAQALEQCMHEAALRNFDSHHEEMAILS